MSIRVLEMFQMLSIYSEMLKMLSICSKMLKNARDAQVNFFLNFVAVFSSLLGWSQHNYLKIVKILVAGWKSSLTQGSFSLPLSSLSKWEGS
jgi:hypothetical protein